MCNFKSMTIAKVSLYRRERERERERERKERERERERERETSRRHQIESKKVQ